MVSVAREAVVQTPKLGKSLGLNHCTVITGASSGLPYAAAKNAHNHGADVYGYSPVMNVEEQLLFTPNADLSIYKKIFYIPENFEFNDNQSICKKYRNVLSTANCDAGIIISGRWGTLNEFTNLFDMGKVIGVLTETSGVANELPALTEKIRKKSTAKIIFNNDPKMLVEQVITAIKAR